MALRQPDKIKSNNPIAYGIVDADEVTGHKSVTFLSDLLEIPDAILSKSGINDRNDAIGQWWYVVQEKSFYKLVDWGSRRIAEGGWVKVNLPDDVTPYGTKIPFSESDSTPLSDKIMPVDLTDIVDNPDTIPPGPSYLRYSVVYDKANNVLLAEWYDGARFFYFDKFPGDDRIGAAPELGRIYVLTKSRVFIGVMNGLCELFKTENL